MDTCSLTIVKLFTYRGQNEEWSNTYHFDGADPADSAAWKALADAIIAIEKAAVPATVYFIRAYGHNAGSEVANWSWDYMALGTHQVGTLPLTGSLIQAPGDVAFWIRYRVTGLSSRGKPIYLRNYYHAVLLSATDTILAAQRTAALAVATKMWDGTLPGGRKRVAPQGAAVTAHAVSTAPTTRTLKRRGKRPPTP